MTVSANSATGTPSWLGAVNDRAGLSVLLEHGPLTRNRICELVGVSKPTASQMMSRLLAAGVIEERGRTSGSAGRSAVVYAARTDRPLGVALDLDAFELRATVVDATGDERPVVRIPLPRDPTERSAVDEVARAIADASAAAGTDPAIVHSVCIGIPGYVDPGETGELFSEMLPAWPVRGLRRILESELGRAVHIENDVNLAALAEREYGAGATATCSCCSGSATASAPRSTWPATCTAAASAARARSDSCPWRRRPPPSTRPHAPCRTSSAAGRSPCSRSGTGSTRTATTRRAPPSPSPVPRRRGRPSSTISPNVSRTSHFPSSRPSIPAGSCWRGRRRVSAALRSRSEVDRGIRRLSRWYPEVVATGVDGDPVLRGARILLAGKVREELLDTVASVSLA